MSETSTGTDTHAKSKTAKRAVRGREDFELPQFEIPKVKLPEVVRDAGTKWINQGKENVEKTIKVAEAVNGAFETALSRATKGAADCSAKFTRGGAHQHGRCIRHRPRSYRGKVVS